MTLLKCVGCPGRAMQLPASWMPFVGDEVVKPYFDELRRFLMADRAEHTILPTESDVFAALNLVLFEQVRVVLLGQDPYHDIGQAHGLAFSVQPGVKIPPSLRNIYKELAADVACAIPAHGYLTPWAEQGVLLLNTVLTVRAHQANSHRGKGWETFTDAIIERLGQRAAPIVFVLWGKPAQAKKRLIDANRHVILEAAHPSPLSAHNGFFGSRPFSRINKALREWGQAEIDWAIRDP